MLGKILNTALAVLGAINPIKVVDHYVNAKPAKDLKAEVERKRTERDRELEERLK